MSFGAGPEKCYDGFCIKSKDNLHTFPGLRVLPRPELDPASKHDHDAWLQEYEQWGGFKCPCGRGYFCHQHGSWISGGEVGSGAAAASDNQTQDSCQAYHYGGQSTRTR